MTDWDWEAQKDDTEAVWTQLAEEHGLPRGMAIALDLEFVPGEEPDRAGFVTALREQGYAIRLYTNDDGEDAIQATVPETTFDAQAIWAEEERATRLALAHGYRPDGWGFWEPEEE